MRSIDNAELVVKSLLGTSTAFEKQMAALEQEQAELDKQDKQEQEKQAVTAATGAAAQKKPATAAAQKKPAWNLKTYSC